jgi:hypothetical protein
MVGQEEMFFASDPVYQKTVLLAMMNSLCCSFLMLVAVVGSKSLVFSPCLLVVPCRYTTHILLIYYLGAEDLRDAENLLDWREQRENQHTTFWPVLARAGDLLRKMVPRPPECKAAIRLVTAVGSAMSKT